MTSILTSPYVEIRIYKYMVNSPKLGWGNTYEVYMPGTQLGDPTNCQVLANAIADAEAAFHLGWVKYDRAVVATWQVDGHPYDPASFVTVPLSQVGGLSLADQRDLGMDTVINFQRNPALGKAGKLAYRQCMGSANLDTGGAGSMVLTSAAAAARAEQIAFLYSEVQDALAELTDSDSTLAMISEYDGPPTVRSVLGLTLDGPGNNKFNHKWFNRTPTP